MTPTPKNTGKAMENNSFDWYKTMPNHFIYDRISPCCKAALGLTDSKDGVRYFICSKCNKVLETTIAKLNREKSE